MSSNLIKHLKTIRKHRRYVRKACFKMGIPFQGIVHDLSKYSFQELSICKYYSGSKSPHANCREKIGYSPSWIHHYHKNKHHWQYWLDIEDWPEKVIPIKMPYKYVIESFCDMLAASKTYNKKNWNESMLLNYWDKKCKGKRIMNKDSMQLLETLILKLYEFGEKDFYKWYKNNKKDLKNKYEQ